MKSIIIIKACDGDEYSKAIGENYKDYPLEFPFSVGSGMREIVTVEEALESLNRVDSAHL